MTDIKYIGSFPPPYGGVTVKNNLIYTELSRYFSIKKGKGKYKYVNQIQNIISLVFWHKPFIIGVSASRGKSEFITGILYRFNKSAMRKSVYFMMGGLEAGRIAADEKKVKMYSNYACIYVETVSMLKCMEHAGMKNVSYFPNCRKRPKNKYAIRENKSGRLRCVFFSNIQILKGVDVILEVTERMPNIDFYFYGYIDEDYVQVFEKKCNAFDNIFYNGVFDGETEDVYQELNQFDILLFPTKWENEGVPGVLVEGKIAGLAEIVTDICYNAELVKDGLEGIIIKEAAADLLETAIKELDENRNKLYEYKKNSQISAEKFMIDCYLEDIEKILE